MKCEIFIQLLIFLKLLKDVKLLVLANKKDLKGAMSASEVSEFLGLTSIKDHDWQVQSCCALTGEGYH